MKRPLIFFFDMDHTLINHDCDVSWKQFVVKHGLAPESDLAEADRYFDDYNAGTLDVEEFYGFQFREFVGISYATMSKLEKGENTTVEVLEKICLKLGCGISDIMEIVPDGPSDGNGGREEAKLGGSVCE